MSVQQYVLARSEREPTFGAEVRAAAAELDLGELLAKRRAERGLTLTELAAATGIAEERLELLDEGDAMTLREMLLLLHVLEVSVSFEPSFTVASRTLEGSAQG
jgi:transcriptional regulator with XRE-family HTH domain